MHVDATPDAAGNPRHRLVFLHGGGVGPWMWRDQVAHFSSRFDVQTPTLPGHGPATPQHFTTQVAAARAVADEIELTRASEPVTVVGFSLGGQTAVQLAADFPDHVARLVVVSSLLEPVRGAGVIGLLGRVTRPLTRSDRFARAQAAQLSLAADMFEDYVAVSRAMTAATLSGLMRANFTFRAPDAVVAARRPTFLMAGATEHRLLLGGMSRLSERMPDAEYRVFPDVGHGVSLAQPAVFNPALESWLTANPAV